jgi:CHAT domain-containing protein
MQFSITTRRAQKGWSVAYSSPESALALPDRQLREASNFYPLPPAAESADWAQKPCAPLCNGTADQRIRDVSQNIVVGEPGAGEVELFGQYLFAVLLGSGWPALVAAAGAKPLELNLCFEANDVMFHRLPWELMFGPTGPLAGSADRTVAITRRIAAAGPEPAPLEIPLRVLFVVGMQMDDSLRPGAELLNLLRQLNAGPNATQAIGLNLRLLAEASTQDLEAAVRDYDPSVLHFICHGRWNGEKPEIVLSQNEKGQKSAEDGVSPDRLLKVIQRKDGTFPPVVVLNACHTAEPNDSYAPFAAALIAQGVPVAVGMAGETADAACRIFTRAFYRALIGGQPVAEATAMARRAAILHYNNFLSTVEWSRPALFMREQTTLQVNFNAKKQQLAAAAFRHRLRKEQDILCDRFDCFRAYHSFLNEVQAMGNKALLVYETSEPEGTVLQPGGENIPFQLGKTWLLDEISWHLVLDGFVPCYLRSGEGFDPPASLLGFAVQLAEVMDEARVRFGLEKRYVSEALQLGGELPERNPASPNAFNQKRKAIKDNLNNVKQDVQSICDAVNADASRLLTDVQQACNVDRLLILIDDLHRYEGVVAPLLREFRDNSPAPMIFTYSSRAKAGPLIAQILQERSLGVHQEVLLPFRDPVETRMAYGQYLLSRQPPVCPTWRSNRQDDVGKVFTQLHKLVKGVPSYFRTAREFIQFSTDFDILIACDDEAILRERRELDAKRP